MSGNDLALKVGWNSSKVSRVENGKLAASEVEIAIYLTSCGVSGGELKRLVGMATHGDDGHWLQPHGQELAVGVRSLITLENTARSWTSFEPIRIPGLLQTQSYMTALMLDAGMLPADGVESRITTRLKRQRVLRGRNAPGLLFYIHENALRLPVGSKQVMEDQIWHLLMESSRPGCEIRVVPVSAGAYAAMSGSFVFWQFHEHSPVVYLELENASLFCESADDIATYRRILANLSMLALDRLQSREWLADLATASCDATHSV